MTKLFKIITLLGLCLSISAGAAPKPKDHKAHHPAAKPKASALPKGDACMGMMAGIMEKMPGMMEMMGGRGMMQPMMYDHMNMMGQANRGPGAGGAMMMKKNQAFCAKTRIALETCWKKGGDSCKEASALIRNHHRNMASNMSSMMDSYHARDPRRQRLMMKLEMMEFMQEMMENHMLKKQ